jgi:DNA repair ATPase RecN
MPTDDDHAPSELPKDTFATRRELKTIVEYQQRLYASMKELDNNHRTIHSHVKKLTLSHNTLRTDANDIIKMRTEVNDKLRSLSDSHAKTRQEIERAVEAIDYIKEQVERIAGIEQRLAKLEQQGKNIWHDGPTNGKKIQEKLKHLGKIERK